MTASIPKLVLCDFPARTNLDGWSSFSPFVLEVARALALAKLPDSTNILRRIERLAPGSMTGGLDKRALAEAWLWEEFADTALYPYVLATRWADDRGWPVPKAAFFGSIPAPVRSFVAAMVR